MTTPHAPRIRAPRATAGRARRGVIVAAGLLTLAAAGCSLPTTAEPTPDTDPSEAPIGSATPDPSRDRLIAEVGRLGATITAARSELAAAVEADGPPAARRAADAALGLLIAPPGATDDGGDQPRPLFPGETLDRDDTDEAADQLTVTLTRARDVGGTLGSTVIDLLRDPIAGDLGAWQRDAAGVLASVDETIGEAGSLEEREVAVQELPGLGTRAIAWTRLTAAASSTDDARAYAERGAANLEVIEATLERLELRP